MTQQIHAAVAQLSARLDNLQSEATEDRHRASEDRNRLIHLDTSVHSRLNEVVNEYLPSILQQLHETLAFQFKALSRSTPDTRSRDLAGPPAPNVEPFDKVLARAERDFPTVFAAWKERLDDTCDAIASTETGNVAHSADPYSTLFEEFVKLYAEGPVLDVGCGPSGRPFYLSAYPSTLVAGIDPLLAEDVADTQAVRGISEYLPWPDMSFSTVISATSLDHCISLDRSIEEMIRVLKPNGRVLLWLGSNPGAPQYRPLDAEFVPADRYHLFHFDIAWFEPMLERRFQIIDRVKLDRAGYSHVFYCLGLRAIE